VSCKCYFFTLPKSEAELAAIRQRLDSLYAERAEQLAAVYDVEDEAGEEETEEEAVEWAENLEDLERSMAEPSAGPEPVALEEDLDAGVETIAPEDPAWTQVSGEARRLLIRSRGLFERMHDEDREEAIDLHERIEQAIAAQEAEALAEAEDKLRELLFFVEGK
jgi:hypothetical protein